MVVKTSPQGMQGPERLFYDKSTYTGTHKQGGPSSFGPYADLGELVDRGNPKNASHSPLQVTRDALPSPSSPHVFPRLLGRTRPSGSGQEQKAPSEMVVAKGKEATPPSDARRIIIHMNPCIQVSPKRDGDLDGRK